MNPSAFTAPAGKLVPTTFGQMAFVPDRLAPSLDLTSIHQLLSDADQKLGELRGIGRYLQNPYLLIRPLQNREAIASSNIEGTYTSLPELLMLESTIDEKRSTFETLEVFNYVRALQVGMEQLSDLPIAGRLIHALHARLLSGLPPQRAGYAPQGEYRREQNFIGKSKDITKSRFNPPPPPIHVECMSDLEKFINSEDMETLPPLVFIALIHYQFETIHPFPDGNGRVGRLLIPLILRDRNLMRDPFLYMSQYFEDHKDEYVDLMLNVSQRGAWIDWIVFFLKGVCNSCESTIDTIQNVRKLQEDYRNRCHQARSSALLLKIIDLIFEKLVITAPIVRDLTGTSLTAAQKNVDKLVQYNILREHDGTRRPKFYFATELMKLFER